MTTADPKLETIERVKAKYAARLERKSWKLDNEAGIHRLADAVIVGDEVKKNSCFGAAVTIVVPALAIGALIVRAAFGASNHLPTISNCPTGQEDYVEFEATFHPGEMRVQYDYRHTNGKLFSCIAKTLEAARAKRDEWLKMQS